MSSSVRDSQQPLNAERQMSVTVTQFKRFTINSSQAANSQELSLLIALHLKLIQSLKALSGYKS